MTVKKYVTIPNLLSLFRIILIPIFVVAYLNTPDGTVAFWPIAVLLLSGITDMFDGMIARKFNQVSDVGKMLDPVADKLTQVAVIGCVAMRVRQLWVLLVIYVIKELVMVSGGLIMLKMKKQVPMAKWFGKVSTFELYTAMLLFLIFPGMPPYAIILIITITVALVMFALIMYMFQFFTK